MGYASRSSYGLPFLGFLSRFTSYPWLLECVPVSMAKVTSTSNGPLR
jgi:hypothetical protein